ncbi:large subunit ribosomal protein L7A [Bacillus ectoiniformans]|uniref:50S ribosomal protein L7ae-like protein n=1 Tax=Bacillus ectoiniformans TaxID=1494429 RepID=UPI00195CDE9A|nr:50S ribosomal protein L7ae-like protein [Bacillus ectoiniformans]MBM7650362.1 large subunit ribosomal protein L7A [Bacillus ectoiniformans]
MSYDKVAQARSLKVGTKQTVKAIEANKAKEVIVAADASPLIVQKTIDLAEQNAVPITYVDSMRKLGEACGIDVKAAAVAIIYE